MRNKLHAKKTRLDGYVFDSGAESRRYAYLRLLEKAGQINALEVHPRFPISINGKLICNAFLDFKYFCIDGPIYEDVKGCKTALSSLKKKMVEAEYGIKVTIIPAKTC